MSYLSDLFTSLYPQAFKVIAGEVRGLTGYEIKMYAHDYTTDFLYSKSFRKTYDHTQPLNPFFSAWMRKRCKRAKCELARGKQMLSLDKVAFMCGFKRDLSMEMFELEDRIRSQYRFLKDKYYVARDGDVVLLQSAFMAWLYCLSECGTVSLDYIGNFLGLKISMRNKTKGILAKLRKLLKEWDEKCNTAY